MMKKLLFFMGVLWAAGANAQFVPGQFLTAAALNTQFAMYSKLSGATFTGPVTIPSLTVTTTATLPNQSANTLLGNVSGSSASPMAVSVGNCSSSSSALSYTSGTGFGCNSSVNAATLGGTTFAAPGPIGSGTPGTGSFTNLSSSGTLTLSNGSVTLPYLATEAADTVVANFTGSTASPVAFAMPSCSGASKALSYTSGTGIACNSAIQASSLGTTTTPTGSGIAVAAAFASVALNDSSGGDIAGVNYLNSGTQTWGVGTSPGNWLVARFNAGSYVDNPISILNSSGLVSIADGLTVTGVLTPSQTSGIAGTTTNNNANAGSVGEYVATTGSGTSLSNGVYADLATESLTAGDWDVECSVYFANSGATISVVQVGVNTAANANPNTVPGFGQIITGLSSPSIQALTTPQVRESLASTTTLRCGAQVGFASGTVTATGFIRARRVR